MADLQAIAHQNKGARFLLTVIGMLSKYAWFAPVKSQNAAAVTEAFRQILNTAEPRHPNRLQTDKGKQFNNALFAALMKRHNIQHFPVRATSKRLWSSNSIAQLKHALWTYLSDGGTVCWVDVIQKLVDAYNHSHHRSIMMAPADVDNRHDDIL